MKNPGQAQAMPMKALITTFMMLVAVGSLHGRPAYTALTSQEKEARAALQRVVQAQQSDMIHHRLDALARLYAPGSEAQDALRVSRVRSQYLFNWGKMRHIDWTGMKVMVRTPSITFVNPTHIRFYALERETYQYHYKSLPKKPLAFGIASRHFLSIVQQDGTWRFSSDDFTNPVLPESMAGQTVPNQVGGHPPHYTLSPNRRAAVQYSETYCGNAPGCGNDGRYNKEYQNYNGNGGDCTNWISQVLYAGGFRMTYSWNYDHSTDEGSGAWANAAQLAEFLESSGRATMFAHGSYAAVTRPTPTWPDGAIETLIPGDLVSYQDHGAIVHTAVVIGYDPKGVILTDTHTNDRYHVPWDFGWGDKTEFYLWHVHYPPGPAGRSQKSG